MGTALNLILPTVVALAVASRGFSVDDEYVRRWAGSAGVDLDGTTGPVVRRSLLWNRRARTIGGLLGFLAPIFYLQLKEGSVEDGGWSLLLMLVGYLAGVLVSEALVNRPRESQGAALLMPRRLQDYLPGYVRYVQRGLGVACLVGAVVYAIEYAAVDGGLPHAPASPTPLGVAGFGLGGACIAAVTEILQRWIVRRRQVVASEEHAVADDALRSWSLHVIAGAGLGLLCIFVGGQFGVIAAITGTVGGIVSLFLILLATAAGFSFWRDLSRPYGFRVHRRAHGSVHA